MVDSDLELVSLKLLMTTLLREQAGKMALGQKFVLGCGFVGEGEKRWSL